MGPKKSKKNKSIKSNKPQTPSNNSDESSFMGDEHFDSRSGSHRPIQITNPDHIELNNYKNGKDILNSEELGQLNVDDYRVHVDDYRVHVDDYRVHVDDYRVHNQDIGNESDGQSNRQTTEELSNNSSTLDIETFDSDFDLDDLDDLDCNELEVHLERKASELSDPTLNPFSCTSVFNGEVEGKQSRGSMLITPEMFASMGISQEGTGSSLERSIRDSIQESLDLSDLDDLDDLDFDGNDDVDGIAKGNNYNNKVDVESPIHSSFHRSSLKKSPSENPADPIYAQDKLKHVNLKRGNTSKHVNFSDVSFSRILGSDCILDNDPSDLRDTPFQTLRSDSDSRFEDESLDEDQSDLTPIISPEPVNPESSPSSPSPLRLSSSKQTPAHTHRGAVSEGVLSSPLKNTKHLSNGVGSSRVGPSSASVPLKSSLLPVAVTTGNLTAYVSSGDALLLSSLTGPGQVMFHPGNRAEHHSAVATDKSNMVATGKSEGKPESGDVSDINDDDLDGFCGFENPQSPHKTLQEEKDIVENMYGQFDTHRGFLPDSDGEESDWGDMDDETVNPAGPFASNEGGNTKGMTGIHLSESDMALLKQLNGPGTINFMPSNSKSTHVSQLSPSLPLSLPLSARPEAGLETIDDLEGIDDIEGIDLDQHNLQGFVTEPVDFGPDDLDDLDDLEDDYKEVGVIGLSTDDIADFDYFDATSQCCSSINSNSPTHDLKKSVNLGEVLVSSADDSKKSVNLGEELVSSNSQTVMVNLSFDRHPNSNIDLPRPYSSFYTDDGVSVDSNASVYAPLPANPPRSTPHTPLNPNSNSPSSVIHNAVINNAVIKSVPQPVSPSPDSPPTPIPWSVTRPSHVTCATYASTPDRHHPQRRPVETDLSPIGMQSAQPYAHYLANLERHPRDPFPDLPMVSARPITTPDTPRTKAYLKALHLLNHFNLLEDQDEYDNLYPDWYI